MVEPQRVGTRTVEGPTRTQPTPWPALFMGLLGFAAALVVGAVLRDREARTLDMATAAALEAVVDDAEHHMQGQIQALERLAASWERSGGLAQGTFEAAAADLTDDYAFIQAIEWVDPSLRVRWIVPLEGNEVALGLDLDFEAHRRDALAVARASQAPTVSHPVELVQGGRGLVVSVPLRVEGRFDGFVLGIYRVEPLFAALLRNVAPGFAVHVTDEGAPLFARTAGETSAGLKRAGVALVASNAWRVEVTPGPEAIALYRTRLPAVVVGGGLLLAFALAAVTRLAWSRTLRNRLLAAEVRRRRIAEEELSMVVEALPDHVWSAEQLSDGFVQGYFSPVIERITGQPADTFRDAPERWPEIVHPADRDRVKRVHRELLSGEREAFAIEYRIETADGELRWVRERVQTTPTERGRRLDGVTSDITDLKRSEEERLQLETQVQQAQKLESLGVLAGGIAHDFNNLLVGVLGHANLALRDLKDDAPARQAIERVERAAHRAAELCRQMLAYAGQATIQKVRLDVRETVEEVGVLLEASKSKKVELVYEFGDGLPPVEADATQIRQVVLNLVTNASEAIGDRVGTIHVSARHGDWSRQALDGLEMGRSLEPGHYVEIVVTDDGCGMDEETRRRFLEPFYTTKFSGRGLGLAAVHGIVRRHNGAIETESAPGEGTSIRVLLPALDATAKAEAPPSKWVRSVLKAPAPAERRTVLLIDDDEDARELGTIALQRAGYSVRVARDGLEGVDLLGQDEEVCCVLLDLTMPRLDGAEALRALRKVRDVPVVLCSGYPEAAAVERFADLDLQGFLAKPYLPEDLLEKVQAALAAAGG